MASYLYALERTAAADVRGRCGHCNEEAALSGYTIGAVGPLARFFLGISPQTTLLECGACAKLSQRMTTLMKAAVLFSWAPLILFFAGLAAYFGSHAAGDEGVRNLAIVLAAMSVLGLAVMLWSGQRMIGRPYYPVAGRRIEEAGRVFWGR